MATKGVKCEKRHREMLHENNEQETNVRDEIKTENDEDPNKAAQEIEFLESDSEAEDALEDDLTDLLVSDWSEREVEYLLAVTIKYLEKGETINSKSFWTKVMADFNPDDRWPLSVVQRKLRQLRTMFADDGAADLSRAIYRHLLAISKLVGTNKEVVNTAPTETATARIAENENEDEDNETMRWTGREVVQLVKSYKRHLKDLIGTPANKDKRKIWDKIAEDVAVCGFRSCDPYAARMKVMNLKKTWAKHKRQPGGVGRVSWPYFSLVDQVMTLESKEMKKKLNTDLENTDDESSAASNDENHSENDQDDHFELRQKRGKLSIEQQPDWFLRFRQEARRRHDEKMKMKNKLLQALEVFAEKCNNKSINK